jgi:hypothetical protein
MKKCPPGVICIENVTMVIVIIVILVVGYMFYINLFSQNVSKHRSKPEKIIIQSQVIPERVPGGGVFPNPSYSFSNLPGDVLLNPYEPPLKDDGYVVPGMPFIPPVPPGRVPINVPTNVGAVNIGYRQYGILKPVRGSTKDSILPLMGRPVNTSRQKFQYYTISNQHNNVKLPIIVRGRSGTTEYGVDELFSGERVLVEGDKTPFEVTIYDNDGISYIPYL